MKLIGATYGKHVLQSPRMSQIRIDNNEVEMGLLAFRIYTS